MKLKNLAALLFRMLGALFVLTGFSEALSGILESQKMGAVGAAVSGLLVGILLIYFSKRLAALFCKGLDDDDSANKP